MIASLLVPMLTRKKLPYSQFAKQMRVSHTTVKRWLDGEDKPNVASCIKIASLTGYPLQQVLIAAGHKTPANESAQDTLPPFREYIETKYTNVFPEKFILACELIIDMSQPAQGDK